MKLKIEPKKYPNGELYLVFHMGNLILGSAQEVEGGYLVFRKKKPQPTMEAAAKQMIDDRLSRLANEEKLLRAALLLIKQGGLP